MGYFTHGCRYCNGDEPRGTCKCHNLSIADIEARDTTCDPEDHD